MRSAVAAADEAAMREESLLRRRSVDLVSAVTTLGQQKVKAAVRSGDAVLVLLSPIIFFLCFYVPLHRRFDAVGGNYAQFLTPIILLQAGFFTAIAATEVAGADARAGVRERMMSLPIPRIAPVLGRMCWVLIRTLIAVVGGLIIGYALGFRFNGSVIEAVGFVALVVVFGLALSLLTDAVGTVVPSATGAAAVLMVPQLLLVLASTGLVPAEGFPGWIQPFVRNQPLSVFTEALRGLSSAGSVDLTAVIVWAIVLVALGLVASMLAGRAQVKR